MTVSYIALGSNLGNPLQQVELAVDAIANIEECDLVGRSPWYKTAPVGPVEQDDFINGVIAVRTSLTAESLLKRLQIIEKNQGRVRDEHWGPRTIDLDILLFAKQFIRTDFLQIPHPQMTWRNFVIYPLADLNPDLIMPNGLSIKQLLEKTSPEGIVRLSVGESCDSIC